MVDTLKKASLTVLPLCIGSLLSFGQVLTVNQDKNSTEYGTFTVSDLSESVLRELENVSTDSISLFYFVTVGGSDQKILGSYTISDTAISFKPRFLPDSKLTHQVNFDITDLSLLVRKQLAGNSLEQQVRFFETHISTQVSKFLPELDTIPQNILRAYLHFTNPMGMENPYNHISVYDSDGNAVDEPFVEITEGLWDSNKTRLTLFFHPGRIKRGVGPNITKGEIFLFNKSYTIKIHDTWKDVNGNPILSFSQKFVMGKPVRKALDLSEWVIIVPDDVISALEIVTSVPVDDALINRMMSISYGNQKKPGRWEQKGKRLFFTPESSWLKGEYQLLVDPLLEDICGNRISAPFDKDMQEEENGFKKEVLYFKVQ